MKKIIFSTFLLFGGLSLVAFSPSSQDATYLNITNKESKKLSTEIGSFTQSETSHETADKTVWNKRHKTWTDFSQSGDLQNIEDIINRN